MYRYIKGLLTEPCGFEIYSNPLKQFLVFKFKRVPSVQAPNGFLSISFILKISFWIKFFIVLFAFLTRALARGFPAHGSDERVEHSSNDPNKGRLFYQLN